MYHVTWIAGTFRGHMAYDTWELANNTARALITHGRECVKVERY